MVVMVGIVNSLVAIHLDVVFSYNSSFMVIYGILGPNNDI